MGLFQKMFGKESCTLCGKECGMMHRTKIKGGEYVCSDCAKLCSKYARLSEMDKQQVEEHIEYMNRQQRIYSELFAGAKKDTFPSPLTKQGISFADELGMFAIVEKTDAQNKINHELFRYDQVAGYERYVEKEKSFEEGKDDTFKEAGVKIRLYQPLDRVELDEDKRRKGMRPHPYVKREIKVVFSTSERDTDYTDNAIAHFDYVLGVHNNDKGLFSIGGTKQWRMDIKAQSDIVKTAVEAGKAAKDGTLDENNEKVKEQFAEARQSADTARTSGLSVYSQRADEAEKKVSE